MPNLLSFRLLFLLLIVSLGLIIYIGLWVEKDKLYFKRLNNTITDVTSLSTHTNLSSLRVVEKSTPANLKQKQNTTNTPLITTHLPVNSKTKSEDLQGQLKVVLFTYMRGGSSFLGEMFNQRSDVFYLYEPLAKQDPSLQKKLLNASLKCDFSTFPDLYHNTSEKDDKFIKCKKLNFCFTDRSKVLTNLRNKHKKNTKIDTKLAGSLCASKKAIVIKIIRWVSLEKLVNNFKNIKVIHLVRDPRAIINSRNALGIKTEDYGQELCNRIKTNLEFVNSTSKTYQNIIFQIRYEDIVYNPGGKINHQQIEVIGLPKDQAIIKWIENNTKKNQGGKFGLSRNSSTVLNNWKTNLNWKTVEKIQKNCMEVLQKLDYKIYTNEKDLKNI